MDTRHRPPGNAASDGPLLEADDLEYRQAGQPLVQGYRLHLGRGEIVGLLGTNGAGKTTTLRMLAGVLPPARGRVRVLGHDLREAPRAARQALGFLPDRPPLYDELTVTEYLELAAALRRVPRARRRAAVAGAIERCGLGDVRHRLAGQLSLGYRQRLGLAQAIVHQPRVILLDEPTSALDPAQTHAVRELIRELGREHAVLLSSHLLGEIEALCQRVQILRQGRLVAEHDLPLASGGWLLETAAPVEVARIGAVTGVGAVEADGARLCLRLEAEPERVLAALVAAGIPVRSFAPQGGGLERLFLRQALGEPGEAGAP